MYLHKLITSLFLILTLTSCEQVAKKLGYIPENSENATEATIENRQYNNTANETTSQSTVVDEFDVVADVWKFVPDYYGAPSGKEVFKGTETLHIKVYSNGYAYAGSMPVNRAVGEAGTRYDFMCIDNGSSKSYYFNSSKLR